MGSVTARSGGGYCFVSIQYSTRALRHFIRDGRYWIRTTALAPEADDRVPLESLRHAKPLHRGVISL